MVRISVCGQKGRNGNEFEIEKQHQVKNLRPGLHQFHQAALEAVP